MAKSMSDLLPGVLRMPWVQVRDLVDADYGIYAKRWFDEANMQAFGTILPGGGFRGPGGVFFITSEKPPSGKRALSVRQVLGGRIETIGEFCAYSEGRACRLAIACEGACVVGRYVLHWPRTKQPTQEKTMMMYQMNLRLKEMYLIRAALDGIALDPARNPVIREEARALVEFIEGKLEGEKNMQEAVAAFNAVHAV
jgi:hypothetical protein